MNKDKFTVKLKNIQRLNGGSVNYVYRLTFDNNSTVILKYFPNHLAIDKDVKMNQKRYCVEKDALKLLGDHCFLEKTHTRIPKLLYFDDNNFIIVMQDAGKQCKTLLKFLLNQTPHTAHSQKIIDILAKEIYNFSIFLSKKV